MTIAVIMDGPCAGMTEQEYDEMRALDCEVAQAFGWKQHDTIKEKWNGGVDWERRDDPLGVPFYSLDMNGAYVVLRHALTLWRYGGRQIFFSMMQKRATFAGEGTVKWPDVLVSLADDLPTHICRSFTDAVRWAKENDFDMYGESVRASEFSNSIVTETTTIEASDGSKQTVLKTKPPEGTPPWVHTEPIQPGKDTLED